MNEYVLVKQNEDELSDPRQCMGCVGRGNKELCCEVGLECTLEPDLIYRIKEPGNE